MEQLLDAKAGYISGSVTGFITYWLQSGPSAEFMKVGIALLTALLCGFAGAAGKYLFDKLFKKGN